MADNKSNRGARDRATVAAGETYEVDAFANKRNISRDEAKALIERVGNNRAKLDAAVAEQQRQPAVKPVKRARTPRTTPQPSATARRARAPKMTISDTVADTVAPAAAAVEKAVVEPLAKAAAPTKRRATAAGRKANVAARRGTARARATAVTAPRTARRQAHAALETAKAGATSRTAKLVGMAAAGLVTAFAVNLGRKATVQAPTALAGDWFDGIKVEHKAALALFDRIQATDSSDTVERTALLTHLKHALSKHAYTEENVIYTALRAWGDKADADKLNHDHGYVKQYLYELAEMDNAEPAFLTKVAAFRADLEAHIREEENAIFPPLHVSLGDAGNAKLTALANKEGFKLA
ncbi:hemerythrin domain-containing protein [Sphingomonas sp. GC_Shp_3]|uniref:hemerythrin domain-containing protein n=1 Tax=Sphingomonas sp. GC_Shp_3 TaxID=2937383 RepID=UPI00226AFD3B|nr:hemerythrin domain-containing protein [Sphingomonas sp. GC_Shp_3]